MGVSFQTVDAVKCQKRFPPSMLTVAAASKVHGRASKLKTYVKLDTAIKEKKKRWGEKIGGKIEATEKVTSGINGWME